MRVFTTRIFVTTLQRLSAGALERGIQRPGNMEAAEPPLMLTGGVLSHVGRFFLSLFRLDLPR